MLVLTACSSNNIKESDKKDVKQTEEKENSVVKDGLLYSTKNKVLSLYNDYAIVESVEKSAGVGLLDPFGKEIIPLKYDTLGFMDDNLLLAGLNNKKGLIDFKGNIILPIEYDSIREFEDTDKYTLARKDDNEYVIDRNGKIIKSLKENDYTSIFFDKMLVGIKDYVISSHNDTITKQFSGSTVVWLRKMTDLDEKKTEYFDSKNLIRLMRSHDLLVRYEGDKLVEVTDANGALNIPEGKYGVKGFLNNNLLEIEINKEIDRGSTKVYKIYNMRTKKYSQGEYINAIEVSDDMVYAVAKNDNKYILNVLDGNGIIINKFEFDGEIKIYGCELFAVKVPNGYYLYKSDGEKYLEDKYKVVDFENSYIKCADAANKVSLISCNGETFLPSGTFDATVSSLGIQIDGYQGKKMLERQFSKKGISFCQENNDMYEVYTFHRK